MKVFRETSTLLLTSRLAWWAAVPVVMPLLRVRAGRGREDPERLGERIGHPSRPRPPGPLCWVHAVSLGEARSVEPIIRWLIDGAGLRVLMTTVTVTSARAMAGALPPGALHQYAPLDQRTTMGRFLDHWRPDCALRVESEFWPEAHWSLRKRGVPRAMVQARLSARSAARWKWLGGALGQLLEGFDPVIAQTAADRKRFEGLGVANVRGPFNLKADAAAPESDPADLSALRADLASRPVWLAASTHAGEEEIVLDAHLLLRSRWPGLLTILLPRHPERGPSIEALVRKRGLSVRCRRTAPLPGGAEIYVADTLGETGLFFRLTPVVLIGGTLVARGGHNLLEPARLDCAILHGPDTANVPDVAAALKRAGAAIEVENADTLAGAVSRLLADPRETRRLAAAAGQVASDSGGVTAQVAELLTPMIARARAVHART